jgi:hypothetical protein
MRSDLRLQPSPDGVFAVLRRPFHADVRNHAVIPYLADSCWLHAVEEDRASGTGIRSGAPTADPSEDEGDYLRFSG